MNVVICDDEAYCREEIIAGIVQWMALTGNTDILYTSFSSSEDLLERWEKGLQIDLLFLDIQLPNELSGMTLAQRIRVHDQNVAIVFVTNYENYVYEGYTVNALRYLRKPINQEDIFQCMDIVYRQYSMLTCNSILFETREQSYVLKYSEIVYIESRLHYTNICLTGNREMPEVRKKIGDIRECLPGELFIQCHRSYVVNLSHIRRFTKSNVVVSNGHVIPVSSTYFTSLHSAFNRFYQEVRIK